MYAASEDLQAYLGELYQSLYQRADGTLDSGAMENDLAAASGEIDAFAGVRYLTPLSSDMPVMPLLKSWTLVLASALAWGRSGKDELPKFLASQVTEIRRSLREIASGSMILPGASEKSDDALSGMTLISGSEPVFTREKMEGY